MTSISLKYILKWIFFALLSSVSAISVCYSFRYLLLNSYTLIPKINIYQVALPLVGALICAFIIYQIRPRAAGEGIPAYLAAINSKAGKMTFVTSLFKYIAAFFTLASGGSGGIVGPLIRVNAGIMSSIGQLLLRIKFNEEDRRTIVICGASATCAAIFHAPVGAGLFAVEILKRANMTYLDLFPSILSSCATIAIIKHLGFPAIYPFAIYDIYTPSWDIFLIIALGFLAGFYSLGYIQFYLFIRKIMGRDKLRKRNMVVSAIIVGLIAFLIDPKLLGTSLIYVQELCLGTGDLPFKEIFEGKAIFIVLLILAISKGITNCATVGSGLSGGFTGPSVIMGLFLGAAVATICGFDPGSGAYSAMLVAGMSGVLSSSVNIPIAASIMGAEIFGPSYALPATISSIIAFQVARATTLYDFQFDNGNTYTEYINKID